MKIQELYETISSSELQNLEKILDTLFKRLNIDISFSGHFLERVNDSRNGKDIDIDELASIFKEEYIKHGVI